MGFLVQNRANSQFFQALPGPNSIVNQVGTHRRWLSCRRRGRVGLRVRCLGSYVRACSTDRRWSSIAWSRSAETVIADAEIMHACSLRARRQGRWTSGFTCTTRQMFPFPRAKISTYIAQFGLHVVVARILIGSEEVSCVREKVALTEMVRMPMAADDHLDLSGHDTL